MRNQTSVAELKQQHPWLDVVVGAARREGAWHWDLEFASVFQQGGGFDLQVGNPPWVRPSWHEDLVLAETDPWWGIAAKPSVAQRRQRRSENLESVSAQGMLLTEVATSERVGELFDPAWQQDQWTDRSLTRVKLGDIGPKWTMDTPLRQDQDRWQALVEIDALAALMLGLSSDQLCAMYRTQFAVLRKYEYKMVFDAEGRKICGYHQSAGYSQSQLQDQAKTGDLPKEWTNLWKLYEQYEEDPTSVDWLGHFTPPFVGAVRESKMRHAVGALESLTPTPAQAIDPESNNDN